MAITRQDVADYLDEQFSSLAVAVEQNALPLTGYKPDIDGALRFLGKSESELGAATVEDSSRDVLFALAEYYAAKRFWRLLGDRVNTTTGTTSYNWIDMRKSAKEMMEDAADRCADLGCNVDGRERRVASFKVY